MWSADLPVNKKLQAKIQILIGQPYNNPPYVTTAPYQQEITVAFL